MAEAKNPKPKKSIGRKQQTVRERTATDNAKKPRRFKPSARKITKPLTKVKNTGKKEINVPLPDNKAGRVLGKKVPIVPGFFKDAWREIRLVTWPTRKETIRLTIAVFVFAFIFAVIVGILDFILDKIFKELIIN